MDALLRRAGIDPSQWRTLTYTYLLMDLRRSGGARRQGSTDRAAQALPIAGLLVGALMNSVVIALLVVVFRDTLTAAVLMVTMTGLTVSMLLIIEFTGSVISAEDYWIIAPRPVSSRTYFAARFGAVLAYVVAFTLLMCFAPAVLFMLWHDLGPGGFVGALAAGVLTGCAGAAVVIGAFTWLIARVAPGRLVRAISWVHLAGSVLSLAGFLIVMRGFEDNDMRDFSVLTWRWVWSVPATWFASIVPALGGTGGAREWLAGSGAALLSVALLGLAAGRMSLDFAGRLAEATATSQPSRRRLLLERIPGFREKESYAIATLIRAQFRYDLRFRLAILGVVPATAFYLFLGWNEGALVDPFNGSPGRSVPIYMAIVFLPMILHGALQFSDQWRAAWLFWALPVDQSRLVLASKNYVAVFFLGTYLFVLAIVWSFFYDRVWHAFVHAAFVGAGAHMLLQGAVILNPALPFAKEPTRGEQSARMFVLFFFAMIGSALAPLGLPAIYARWQATLVFAVLLAAVTILLEWMAHRRVRAVTSDMEWR